MSFGELGAYFRYNVENFAGPGVFAGGDIESKRSPRDILIIPRSRLSLPGKLNIVSMI